MNLPKLDKLKKLIWFSPRLLASPPNFGLPFQLLASPTNFSPAAPTSGLPTPNFWPLNLVFPQLLASYPTSGMPPNFWPPPSTSGLRPNFWPELPVPSCCGGNKNMLSANRV